MKQKWVYPLLIVFVAFFVLSNPESAGPQARSFFGWVGDQAEALGTFLDGVFDDGPGGSTDTGPAEPAADGGDTGTDGGVNDSFNTLARIEGDGIAVTLGT